VAGQFNNLKSLNLWTMTYKTATDYCHVHSGKTNNKHKKPAIKNPAFAGFFIG
jgi:hypothetical protein